MADNLGAHAPEESVFSGSHRFAMSLYRLDQNRGAVSLSDPFMKAAATIQFPMPNTVGVVVALRGHRNSWLITQKPYQASTQEKTI
jgi:hypothetical protein